MIGQLATHAESDARKALVNYATNPNDDDMYADDNGLNCTKFAFPIKLYKYLMMSCCQPRFLYILVIS